jgi:iron complex outermembrane receptor protein
MAGNSDLSLKFRAAYGKAVRWPELTSRLDNYFHASLTHPALTPETQSGVEGGFDLSYHEKIGVSVTRYDQTAAGLMQVVPVKWQQQPPPTNSGPGSTNSGPGSTNTQPTWITTYWLQNVGQISNKGWELQAYVRRGALSLNANMALTRSRVEQLAIGYVGDLRVGDRMLGVPARTVGVSAIWTGHDWSTSLSATRASDWINYDRAAMAALTSEPVGNQLRNYWLNYQGFTHLRASFTHALSRGFTLQLIGDNLLDKQIGEPDNLTVVPGRTFSVGIKAAF